MIDRSWRHHAKRAGLPVVKNRHQDLTHFPVEKARLKVAMPLLYFTCFAVIAYGWVLEFHTNLAGPIIIMFFIGFGIMASFQIMQILLVDLNPGNAAASTAAVNLFRCLLGAGSTAATVPMINRMSIGWTYTFAGILWLSLSPMLWLMTKYGPRWRKAKKEIEIAKQVGATEKVEADQIAIANRQHSGPGEEEKGIEK